MFLGHKKKKSSFEKHAIIFHSVCRFKKKKGFWFLGSRMNKNSWFQIMEYFIILISFLMIMKDRETYTKSMYINLNLGEVQHSNHSFLTKALLPLFIQLTNFWNKKLESNILGIFLNYFDACMVFWTFWICF